MKTLSYIIPLYNSAEWLEKCLYSVLNQDFPESEVEIICVNDGSPDNSADIAREIAKEHPCIVVIDQENQGPSGARNTGMRAATGKYLCFVDPDDFVEPNVYGRLIQQMEKEQLDMLRFDYQVVNEHYENIPKPITECTFNYTPQLMSGAEFLSDRLGLACNIWRYIYRRVIITENNIWCYTGDYYDDVPWLPLVLMKAERINLCDLIVYNYMERSESLVNASSNKAIQRKIDGTFLLLELLKNQRAEQTNPSVVLWYDIYISHSITSLLTLIGVYQYDQRDLYVSKIKQINVFPLTTCKAARGVKCKMRIINISVKCFLWLIYIKNRRFRLK